MNRLLLLAFLIYIVTIDSCIIRGKKGKPDIRVIELDDSNNGSTGSEFVALHLPDRRRREVAQIGQKTFCKSDDDCGSGSVCLAHLTCVKGTRQTLWNRSLPIKNWMMR